MNNKAVSMVALVLTIVIIIILAAITVPLLSNVMSDSTELDAKEEFANVVAVVQSAKKDILVNRFVPNEDYVISDEELDAKYTGILTEEERQEIKDANKGKVLEDKFFLMNQDRFNSEFGSDFNIARMRETREYLVNYMLGVVVLNNDGKRMAQGDLPKVPDLIRGDVNIGFSPNGNAEWYKRQSTRAILVYDENTTTLQSAYCVWSESISSPDDSEFTTDVTTGETTRNGSTVKIKKPMDLEGKTGNGWYLWVKVEYFDDGELRTKYEKSEAFFIDNTAPTFELEVS